MILDIRVIAFSFIVLFGYETDSFTSFSRKVLKFASPTTFMSHDYEGTKSESRVSDMSSLNQVIGNVQLASTHSDPSDVLCMSTNELSQMIGGSGKAKFLWEYLRNGVDPLSLAHSFQENIDSKLSIKAKNRIQEVLGGKPLLSATIESEVLSSCGTRKLLLNLADNLRIESVLIPSFKYKRTTLCVSTQIGCDRGCAFCLTGKMGLVRNLTSSEIISQVILGIGVSKRDNMPPLTNVVFMGMGDSGRNMEAVGAAVQCLVDRERMSMAQSKVCVSSVGPSPQAFSTLAAMPASLAWSLHSADDVIRKKLVPSTKHSVVDLRDGLLDAMQSLRPSLRTRTLMVAITLIEGVNDSIEDARKLAEFVRPMLAVCPKIALDLIPYNDISVDGFKRPSRESVNEFQRYLREAGFFCSVRVTRGDEESAACGMLATSRKKEKASTKL